ncbi:MAG: branched-chain amino acid ABC transporter permease [Candidatus Bathyarchaeia archaeon]
MKFEKNKFLFSFGLVVVFLAIILPLIKQVYLLSSIILILMNYAIYAGWNILGGFTGYNNFGHVAFFGIGAYIAAMLTKYFGLYLWSLPIIIAATSIIAALVGWPLLRLRGIYFGLGTIPINYIFQYLIILLPFTGGALGLVLKSTISLDPLSFEILYYELFLVLAALTFIISYKLLNSRMGLGLIAIREDEDTALVFGVPVTKLKVMAFIVSAIPTALAGGLYACYTLYVEPAAVFMFSISLYSIGANYLGGRGTVMGPLISSVIITTLMEQLRFAIGVAYEGLSMLIFGLIIILIILYCPEGIVGRLKKKSKMFF